ncbi:MULTISPECIES: chemotaxis protein CheW [unclassified Chamaesiphon]|uniref:chemotaxis protein CheW n=1 Tax=unclassified Chamaesiphon TaxID=2620921 RepID=UPI00286ABBC8|nr:MULTISPECIES: chemotaxis protein CheW [unclassified Chamaesiphon]
MTVTDLTPPAPDLVSPTAESASRLDRFILTQVAALTLVFPATWVAEIWRVDRWQILDLPFYDPLLVGIANYNGLVTPLIAAARLLALPFTVPERSIAVRLNEAAGRLENVSIIVDRAIGTSGRSELPPGLFTADRDGSLVMMQSQLVPTDLWQPQYWSVDR